MESITQQTEENAINYQNSANTTCKKKGPTITTKPIKRRNARLPIAFLP